MTKDVVQLGTTPRIVAVFTSGRNNIRAATLRLSAPSGIQFHYQDATLISDRASLTCNSESVTLSDVPPNSTILVHIPHSDASAFHAMVRASRLPYMEVFDLESLQRVNITVEYSTVAEPDIPRILQLVRFVLTALPVAINVEDFFRGTRCGDQHELTRCRVLTICRLFTRFTLSSTSPQHVRILSTELISQGEGSDGLKITKCTSTLKKLVVCFVCSEFVSLAECGP